MSAGDIRICNNYKKTWGSTNLAADDMVIA